jgi:hypothetical protein
MRMQPYLEYLRGKYGALYRLPADGNVIGDPARGR